MWLKKTWDYKAIKRRVRRRLKRYTKRILRPVQALNCLIREDKKKVALKVFVERLAILIRI
jgi:hypothetical protein